MLVRVPFADVDMHGHVHNGQYFSYAESAVNEYIRCHDLAKLFDPGSSAVVYHVRKVEIRYDGAAGFDDVLDVVARLARIGTSSLTFTATARQAESGAAVVEAEIVWVCVDGATGKPVPIPEPTRQALAAADR